MKNHLNTLVVVASLAFCIVFTACQTYEDGPALSLRSKKERVSNKWRPAIVSRNDLDETDEYGQYTLDFDEAGAFHWLRQKVDGDTTDIQGTWSLSSANRQIKLSYLVAKDTINFKERLLYMDIQRLKEDEMWLNFFDDGDYHSLRLIPR